MITDKAEVLNRLPRLINYFLLFFRTQVLIQAYLLVLYSTYYITRRANGYSVSVADHLLAAEFDILHRDGVHTRYTR